MKYLLLGGLAPLSEELLQHLAVIALAEVLLKAVNDSDSLVGQPEHHFLLARCGEVADWCSNVKAEHVA